MLNQRGGHVLFGVMRERDVVDQQVSERTIEEISTEFLRIEPSVFPMVERVRVKGVNEVIVITDTIPVNRKRQAVGKQLPELNYCILHHQSRSHYGLQVADYYCWAIFQKWQKGESTWYDRIKPAVRGEFDASRVGMEC